MALVHPIEAPEALLRPELDKLGDGHLAVEERERCPDWNRTIGFEGAAGAL